ncbi:hypothetical protein BDA96_10G122700 [Sorghum bicolor]|uniref:Uncharacterized protein n=1 Tax=Sorghum bicolor TaxID=4558 RepID=A0A921Q1M9_SORBI|nr:hypothetical protein BDA96_10G122700 [Sorghum bicolor]
MTSSSRVDAVLGSCTGALADCGLCTGFCSAPRYAGCTAPCPIEPGTSTLVAMLAML